jgi:hypothetical protein
MSIADPVTVTARSPVPQLVFAKIRNDGYGSERIDTGGTNRGIVTVNTPGKNGNRHYVKATHMKDAVNPYSGLTTKQSLVVSMSISRPSYGFTDAEVESGVMVLYDYLLDSEVTILRLIQNQS